MSRRFGLALAALLISTTVAGCGLPNGLDGDLVDGWVEMPEPEHPVPEAGVCHVSEYQRSVRMHLYNPVSCDDDHQVETVYVGFFEGEIAERATPPEPGTSQWRVGYKECDSAAAEYLGADFRHGWLWLGLVVPTEAAWNGGARWFRCDLEETRRTMHWRPMWPGSRRDALTSPSKLMRGCFDAEPIDGEGRVELGPVDCGVPHNAEFVGVWRSGFNSYPTGSREFNQVHAGCREQVAEYVGLPVDDELPYRTGTIFDHIGEEDWENGDRAFRCYLWLEDAEFTESLKDAGPSALPVL